MEPSSEIIATALWSMSPVVAPPPPSGDRSRVRRKLPEMFVGPEEEVRTELRAHAVGEVLLQVDREMMEQEETEVEGWREEDGVYRAPLSAQDEGFSRAFDVHSHAAASVQIEGMMSLNRSDQEIGEYPER